MPDPVPPVPAAGQYEQKPFEWFAEAFPFIDAKSAGSRKAHEKEFVLLQKKINSVPKNRVSHAKLLKVGRNKRLLALTSVIDVLERPQGSHL